MTSWSRAWRNTKWGSARAACRDEDPPVDDLAERRANHRRRQLGHRGHQLVVDPGAGRGGHPEHLLAGLGHRREACQHDVAQARRQDAVARLASGGEDLLGVERVPAGPLPDPRRQVRIRRPAELVGDQAHEVVAIEPREVDAIDTLAALELGEVGHHLVVRLELVGPDRGDQQDAFVAQVADEEGEQVPRRRIGPLEILDDDDGRRAAGQPVDDAEHELEQAHLREPVVAAGLPAGRRRRRDRPPMVGRAGRAARA